MQLVFNMDGIIFDDAFQDERMKDWSQICHSCIDKYHLLNHEGIDFEYSPVREDTCGIAGCDHEAEYYIGFEPDILCPQLIPDIAYYSLIQQQQLAVTQSGLWELFSEAEKQHHERERRERTQEQEEEYEY